MNDLQNVLLNLAKEYIKVCELLNLQYYTIGGTLLGAIRHHGFIPWDDDMDFAMPRKDYDIFISKGQKYLPNYLFIQTNKTDKNYFNPYCKVRNSNTTMIEESVSSLGINHGCWIDIFPLDGISKYKKKANKCRRISNLYFMFLNSYITKEKPGYGRKVDFLVYILKKVYFMRKIFLLYRDSYIKRVRIDKCDDVCIYFFSFDQFAFRKEWFGLDAYAVFEGVKMRIPDNYKTILELQYGDWTVLPPVEDRVCKHKSIVDLDNPYTVYVRQ